MSLNKDFYEAYKAVSTCNLVSRTSCTDADMKEFETLLNNAQPSHDSSLYGQYELARSMYRSNPRRYLSYITRPANNVSALILWTESKHIVDYFGLRNIVYLTWDRVNNRYVVLPFRKQNNVDVQNDTTSSNELNQSHMRTYVHPHTSNNNTSRIARRRGAIFKNDSQNNTTVSNDLQSKQWADVQ